MKVIVYETGAEILKAIRSPEFLLPTVLMPCAFYSLFGVMLGGSGKNSIYLLATYGVFAVMGPSIFGFGVGVASERDRGWLQLKRAAPSPAYSYVTAKLITTILFATLALLPVYIVAGFLGEVELPRQTWVSLYFVHLCATIPFVLIGLILGLTFNSGGAVAISNIVFLGLSVLGGLWFPVFAFPDAMQLLAKFMPSYHLGELALTVVGLSNAVVEFNFVCICVMSLILLLLTLKAWSHQP